MYEEYDFFLNKINEIFEAEYIEAYRKIKGQHKRKLNGYLSDLYRKWYFSTLIEGSALSPANIIANLKAVYAMPPDIFDHISLAKPVVQKNSFAYTRERYAGPDYPVVADLKRVVDACKPFIVLDEFGQAVQETRERLEEDLLIRDNYYIDYLLEIACELKLCEEGDSIYVRVIQQTKAAKSFFQADKKKIFKKIFQAAAAIFVDFLNQTLPFGGHTEEFVHEALRNTYSTDQIYQKLYALNGVDFDMIWDETIDDSEFPPEIREYLSLGIYYLGVGIDKYFFTPMGYYLKLIEPFYMLPTRIDEDMAILYNAVRDHKEIEAEVYSPCSEYFLTKFGAEFFGVKNYKPAPPILSKRDKDEIIKLILSLSQVRAATENLQLRKIFHVPEREEKITVYQLKITALENKRFWLTLEVPDDMTLADLQMQLCYALDLDIFSDYSFFIGMEESPFKQITSMHHKLRTKKAEQVKLSELLDGESSVLKYITENTTPIFSALLKGKTLKFEIKLTKIKPEQYHLLFPRVYRKSKLFSDFLESNELS